MTRALTGLAAAALIAAGLTLGGARSAGAGDYGAAKLDAFVAAVIEVSRRIEAWRPRIESAADEDTRNALIEQATADLAGAVTQTEGITGEEYREIYDAAREDEALRGRIDTLLSARR